MSLLDSLEVRMIITVGDSQMAGNRSQTITFHRFWKTTEASLWFSEALAISSQGFAYIRNIS